MRYFLDTEFDGFGGTLLSLALVPEDGGDEYYVTIDVEASDAWVTRNVVPYLDTVPEALRGPRLSRADAAADLAYFLSADDAPHILADWPEDIAQFAMLLLVGPGRMVEVPGLRMDYLKYPGWSASANSAVPHNALHDARALRDQFAAYPLD